MAQDSQKAARPERARRCRILTTDRRRSVILHVLFAASGFAGLVYEILWLRELAGIFGASAEAAAAVLAAFFLGLAVGSELFGRLADRTGRPLRLYALLEVGIAGGALLLLVVLEAYRSIYDGLYNALSGLPGALLLAKTLLAGVAILPATVFMGGTLPALGRAVAAGSDHLGHAGGKLYSANIVGAVLGATLATFALPLWLGVDGSYALAVGLSLAIAATAAALREEPLPPATPGSAPMPRPRQDEIPGSWLLLIALASGFITLALQVLWTRMFALVLHNSVYSFGAIVVVFLLGLAAGTALVSWLVQRYDPRAVLRISLAATAVLVALTPGAFVLLTRGLRWYGIPGTWLVYSAYAVGLALVVITPAVMAAGMTLPCVWELWRDRPGSGSRLGRPTAVNTIGAILGSLFGGFVALPTIGLGGAIAVMALAYVLLAEIVHALSRPDPRRRWERLALYPPLVAVFILAAPTDLPTVRLRDGERLLWSKEGARGAVAVVEIDGDRRIKLDNHYSIGGSRYAQEERRQAHLPLLLHHAPRSVAFIGMGTGITAGAALAHRSVDRVVVLELVPEIVQAADRYFVAWNAGIVRDPRVDIIVEDARNHLMGTEERFDVIIGDLFVPWRAGVGALYTREHLASVRERLEPAGIFAQWIPLWQLSEREFDIILATFLDVFERVTLWRWGLPGPGDALALVAHRGDRPVSLALLRSRLDALHRDDPFNDPRLSDFTRFMTLYAGDLSGGADWIAAPGLNTENRPRIEWLAPRTQRAAETGIIDWFSGEQFADFLDELNRRLGPQGDTRLASDGPHAPRIYRNAGADLYRAEVLDANDRHSEAVALRQRVSRLLKTSDPTAPARAGDGDTP